MATSFFSTKYVGLRRRLVISLDVGTTYSGASYMILKPGVVPERFSVTNFVGQEDTAYSGRVPTVLLYDDHGTLMKCGAEAITEYDTHQLGVQVQWFKLLLAPRELLDRDCPEVDIPEGLTAIDVLGHYLNFLKERVHNSIVKTQPEGQEIWKSLAPEADYVLSHPNGWEGAQQKKIREAAIKGGLISSRAIDEDRIQFVTEGEASFHWCMSSHATRSTLKVGSAIVIVDAGGGTVDTSSFRVTSLKPLEVEEIHTPTCKLAGSVYVTQALARKIEVLLEGSRYADDQSIDDIVDAFDRKTKRLFTDSDNPVWIKFGSSRDNDPGYDIELGRLKVQGDLIAESFSPSCTAIISAVKEHVSSDNPNQCIFLVGGFSASPFLCAKVEEGLGSLNVEFKANDCPSSKTVAEGGLLFYGECHVTRRIAKYTIGIKVERDFTFTKASHIWRFLKFQRQTNPINGASYLPGGFLTLVEKGRRGEEVARGKEFRRPVYLTVTNKQDVAIRQKIVKYTGSLKHIAFLDLDDGISFKPLCTFKADPIPSSALKQVDGPRGRYYEFRGMFVVALGGTEVKCRIEWDESGKTRRSLATSIWVDKEGKEEEDDEKEGEEDAIVALRN